MTKCHRFPLRLMQCCAYLITNGEVKQANETVQHFLGYGAI
jgi:hypothetical protein